MKLDVGLFPLAIVVVAYCFFVYASESLNPFIKPRSYSRRRKWHLGRLLAASVFLASGFASAGFYSGLLTQKIAGLTGMILWMALALAVTVYHRRA